MNYYAPWIDPRVKLVRSEQLIAYLRRRAWREEGLVRKYFYCYRHPTTKAPVFVPTHEETDDQPLRIFEAVTELSRIEDRYAGDVLTDLLAPPAADVTTMPSAAATAGQADALAAPSRR